MTTTIKTFAAESHIPATLIRAVVRQVGGWASFREMAADVANHGADAGFSGFCYYTDTVAFTKRQKSAVLEMAKEQASDFGSDSVYSMIAGFRCTTAGSAEEVAEAIHNPRSEDRTAVFNALAWYALEEVARSYVDFCDR